MKENNTTQISGSLLQRFFQVRELPILLYIIIMMVVFSIAIDGFLAVKNFENISRQITTIGIVSVGMTLIILTGGIDLSVGAMLSFAINIGGQGIVHGWPMWIVYPFMLLLGLVLGLINGFLVTRIAVPALIITLGTMNIYRGILMVITKGRYITPIPSAYNALGRGFVPFIIFAVILALFIFITLRTRFGRNLFSIGGAEQSALYSGVPVRRYKMIVYVISGFLSALAGLILIGKSGFIQPQAGTGYELNAIAAVVIGGTSIFGGSGSVLGTFLGSVLMGLILAGLTMLAVNPYWIGLITGVLIILAIAVDSLRVLRR
ncbi:MAG: ABC transporter permease [Spirochaetaceae bacterium]|nr:MAG: ABC transporter permease [Spirochaetaceae bacterium]